LIHDVEEFCKNLEIKDLPHGDQTSDLKSGAEDELDQSQDLNDSGVEQSLQRLICNEKIVENSSNSPDTKDQNVDMNSGMPATFHDLVLLKLLESMLPKNVAEPEKSLEKELEENVHLRESVAFLKAQLLEQDETLVDFSKKMLSKGLTIQDLNEKFGVPERLNATSENSDKNQVECKDNAKTFPTNPVHLPVERKKKKKKKKTKYEPKTTEEPDQGCVDPNIVSQETESVPEQEPEEPLESRMNLVGPILW